MISRDNLSTLNFRERPLMTCFIYILDSSFSSSSKFWSSKFPSGFFAARKIAQMTTEMIECYHLR